LAVEPTVVADVKAAIVEDSKRDDNEGDGDVEKRPHIATPPTQMVANYYLIVTTRNSKRT